jgi:hypothetical protein
MYHLFLRYKFGQWYIIIAPIITDCEKMTYCLFVCFFKWKYVYWVIKSKQLWLKSRYCYYKPVNTKRQRKPKGTPVTKSRKDNPEMQARLCTRYIYIWLALSPSDLHFLHLADTFSILLTLSPSDWRFLHLTDAFSIWLALSPSDWRFLNLSDAFSIWVTLSPSDWHFLYLTGALYDWRFLHLTDAFTIWLALSPSDRCALHLTDSSSIWLTRPSSDWCFLHLTNVSSWITCLSSD